ncbi:hypothetical protein BCR32DRAFT_269161 [Anaeromyces robustus]|uniref:FGFR1 oncogene partner (FOP) N-terminal dimerisation domain-containing protein n=1 Tax=Anaeromyces robustus TaxID=1754192 RepID=A0A1Y1X2C3_9FUNG|nr:hypothetical protein BCR32DRAFT_269161 [Anaeromyces robustus]|eukprot:ORX79933.1 hypothetical protein BCR32DRAFT_269161 [Anaeromyces robustus]
MKSTKELENLKRLVSNSLVKDGTLGKIKAELRASVFSVINSNKNSSVQIKNRDENIKKINTIKNLDGGIKALELICDFLSYYGMTYTKSVLLAEASLPESNKQDDNNKEPPLLYTILRSQFKSNVDSSILNSMDDIDNFKLDGNILSNSTTNFGMEKNISNNNDDNNNVLDDRKKERIIDDDDDSENKSDDSNSDSYIMETDLQTSDCSLTSENVSKYDYYEEPELKDNSVVN